LEGELELELIFMGRINIAREFPAHNDKFRSQLDTTLT
jgi:hypothetical protein